MISTQSVGLVIDTVICLTLDKWETVSGQFGGYLSGRKYTGHYHVDKGILTVSYGGYSESTQVGNHFLNPKPPAEIILGELVGVSAP
jgi:hypothetical protein